MELPNDFIDVTTLNPATLCRHAYYGSGGFKTGAYLVPHKREKNFSIRKSYSFYVNFFDRVCNALVNPCFNIAPSRSEDFIYEPWTLFKNNCDGSDTSFDSFAKTVLLHGQRDGIVFAVVENYPEQEQVSNLSDALSKRILPYIYIKSVEDLASYTIDRFGNLTSIVLIEDGPLDKTGVATKQYRQWDKQSWSVYSDSKFEKRIASGDHGLGIVPVIAFRVTHPDKTEDKLIPIPALYSIARTCHGIYNINSELRTLQRAQGFALLTSPKDRTMAGTENQTKVIGTDNLFEYDAEHGGKPEFIAPPAGPAEIYMKDREFLIQQLFQQAGLEGVVGVKDAKSGLAKQWDFQAHREKLQHNSQALEAFEYNVMKIFERYVQKDLLSKYSVNYPDKYGIVDSGADALEADAFLALGYPAKASAEIKKHAFRSYAAGKDDVEEEAIQAAIDEIDVQSGDESQSKLKEAAPLDTSNQNNEQ